MLEALRQIQAREDIGRPAVQSPPSGLQEDPAPKQAPSCPPPAGREKDNCDLAGPAAVDLPAECAVKTSPDVAAPVPLPTGDSPPSPAPQEILSEREPAGKGAPPSSTDGSVATSLRSEPATVSRGSHRPSLDLPKTVALKAAPPKATGPIAVAIAAAPPRIELPPEATARPATPVAQDLPGGRCDLGSLLTRSPDGRHEEFERTAENILAQLAARRSSMLLFLGTSRAEADCAVLVRLGAALARHAATDVLLVDCTFQTSPLPEPSGRHSRHTLVDVLRGAADWRNVIATTNVPGLHVLRGSRFPGSGAPPDGLKFGPLLEPLRRQYRLVLLLTATSTHSDVARLVRHCDGTYLLMSLHHTAPNEAKEALRRVVRCGGHVLGCVVTGV